MIAAASAASPQAPLSPTMVPVRSPRTSIVLAELARQRRLERRQRRLQRQRRRQAWARVAAWFSAFGHWSGEPRGAQGAPAVGLSFAGATPLVCAPQPSW
jgi:hypothetical protein